MFGSPGNTGQPEGDQYVGELQTAIEGAHMVARETLKQSQKRMKRDYDVKVRVRELKLGDLVYQLDTAIVKGKTRKLSPSWKGPIVVIEKLTPYLYKIKLKWGIITANHDRLKLCQDREVPEWAQKLSQQIIKGTGYTGLFESLPSHPVSPFNSCLQLSYILVPFGLSGVPRTPEHQFRRQPNFPTQHHHIGCVPCASIYRGP
jgi:hypothetical protein